MSSDGLFKGGYDGAHFSFDLVHMDLCNAVDAARGYLNMKLSLKVEKLCWIAATVQMFFNAI